MALVTYTNYYIITLIVLCVFVWYRRRWRWWITAKKRSTVVMNWPGIGMLPGLLLNACRIHDFLTDLLEQGGRTFQLKGPCFGNVDFLLTCDPANVHYVLSKNFSNFSKGPDFNKFFDILGDGIFNSDSKSWENQRKTAMSLLNHHTFQKFVATTSWNKVETGLIPILGRVADLGAEVDLQDLFKRFTFDSTCILVLGHDPGSLSTHDDLPHHIIQCEKALSDAEETIFYRHILPEFWWKLQRWLQIGREKKLSNAVETFDQFLAHCISLKREQLRRNSLLDQKEEIAAADLLTSYMKLLLEQKTSGSSTSTCTSTSTTTSERFLMDTLLSMVFAGTDTISSALTWFFWLLATNPSEEIKIREEIETNLLHKKGDGNNNNNNNVTTFLINTKELVLNKLIYLHGALCESLRLFPPVPLQHKAPLEADILPSGHRVVPNAKTVLCFYSMGRMESIWGKDCLEFKPERWISERGGGLKREPSFKFPAFNAGPRSCVGKETSFLQLKIVAATVIHHYKIEVVKGHPISPSESVILHMKHGLKVRVTKRGS